MKSPIATRQSSLFPMTHLMCCYGRRTMRTTQTRSSGSSYFVALAVSNMSRYGPSRPQAVGRPGIVQSGCGVGLGVGERLFPLQ